MRLAHPGESVSCLRCVRTVDEALEAARAEEERRPHPNRTRFALARRASSAPRGFWALRAPNRSLSQRKPRMRGAGDIRMRQSCARTTVGA